MANGKIHVPRLAETWRSYSKFRARDSKKVKTNHAKTRLGDISKTLLRFHDPAKIFRDPRFLRYHSPPLKYCQMLKPRLIHKKPEVHTYMIVKLWDTQAPTSHDCTSLFILIIGGFLTGYQAFFLSRLTTFMGQFSFPAFEIRTTQNFLFIFNNNWLYSKHITNP